MPGSLYNADNVVVGLAALYLKPWVRGQAAGWVTDATPLWDVDAWESADFFSVGATNEGFKINVETSTTQVTIEEQSTPVDERVESKAIGIEAALAEDTLQSMRLAWGGSDIVASAAASAKPGKQTMTLSDNIEYYFAALEFRNYYGFARRILVPKTSVTGSGETSFRRAADKRMYPVRVASLCRPTEIEVVDIISAPLP
jgi:hypothetical protein